VPSSAGAKTRGWAWWLKMVLIAAIVAGGAIAIYAQRSNLHRGLRHVGHLDWGWVLAASLSEVLSMVALARLYRALMRASGARVTTTSILAACLTANAISIAVPVIGAGMGSRQAYRQFREAGADPGAASLALTLAGVVSTVTLATVVTTAAVLSGNPTASAGGLAAAVALLAVAVAVAVELRSERGRARLTRLTALVLRYSQRLIHRPRGPAEALAQQVLDSIRRLRLGPVTLTEIVVWGLVNWWADVACLGLSLRGAGITLPVGTILLVWTAGAGAASLSPTPAGLGAVEIAMVAALAGAAVRGSYAITAVLVYRGISLKGTGTLWAALYRYVFKRGRGAQPS
jgi:putative heme transporter